LAAGDAAEVYEKMMDDGKLEYDDKELGHAISKQVSFVTAQHFLETPPAHRACASKGPDVDSTESPKDVPTTMA
jgi:hypothetical protein